MGTLHEDQYSSLITFHSLFLEWQIFQTNVAEEIEAHILFYVTFYRKLCSL